MADKTIYQISISMNEGIAEITFTGEVTKDIVDELHENVLKALKGKNPKAILCDLRGLKGRVYEFSGAYFRTRSIPPDIKKIPGAIVDSTDNKDFISFYETTAANVGQTIKWFADIEAARKWLKSKI